MLRTVLIDSNRNTSVKILLLTGVTTPIRAGLAPPTWELSILPFIHAAEPCNITGPRIQRSLTTGQSLAFHLFCLER